LNSKKYKPNPYSNTATKTNGYNVSSAFPNNQGVYVSSMGSKTHTNGFSFHPPYYNVHKFSNSLYGEDVKPKIAGKDIL